MKCFRLFIPLLVLLAGCSNSKSESAASADSTASPNPVIEAEPEYENARLTSIERERIKEELFFFFHDRIVYIDSSDYVQSEYINVDADKVAYKATFSRLKEDTDDGVEQTTYYRPDSLEDVEITAEFKLFAASESPEGSSRNFTVKLSGNKYYSEWVKDYHYDYSEGQTVYEDVLSSSSSTFYPDENAFVVNLTEPRIYTRETLYLKARITSLNNNDLGGYSKDELGYFRNEIFARHGHTFKTPKMTAYFANVPWYSAWVDDATPFLNKTEQQNVEFIKQKENGMAH